MTFSKISEKEPHEKGLTQRTQSNAKGKISRKKISRKGKYNLTQRRRERRGFFKSCGRLVSCKNFILLYMTYATYLTYMTLSLINLISRICLIIAK